VICGIPFEGRGDSKKIKMKKKRKRIINSEKEKEISANTQKHNQ